jgi:uncharacterized membrane protein YhaH (DUF805 family)
LEPPPPGQAAQYLLPALLSLVVGGAFLYMSLAITVKRWHDRDKSGWYSLASVVPLLNLWPFIELGFLDGSREPNHYGPSPKGGGIAETFS